MGGAVAMMRSLGVALLVLCIKAAVVAADYYTDLGVPRNADDRVIKRAYRKLSLKYHPDKWSGDTKVAEKKFAEIAKAYEILSDKKKRKTYDTQGEEGLKNLQQQVQRQVPKEFKCC